MEHLSLQELPPSFGELKWMKTLHLCSLNLKTLPATFGALSGLQELTIKRCSSFKEIPTCLGQLTSLLKLELSGLSELKELPSTISSLTRLQELTIKGCAMSDMPRCIECLTLLQKLVFDPGHISHNVTRDAEEAFQVLACVVPSLQQLRHLSIPTVKTLSIALSLKAWPPPLLLDLKPCWLTKSTPRGSAPVGLSTNWRELGLPAEAVAWSNAEVLSFFRLQQQKLVALVSAQHVRLGVGSCASSLNQLARIMIADELLGGWTLCKKWEREAAAREGSSNT